jgi:lipoprotein NlpI
VPVLAAALNVGGIILIDEKKLEDAKLYFESALKLDPNFVLAQNNLQVAIGMMDKGK